jgi:hypothetical protein
LSVPYRPGTSAYKPQVKTRGRRASTRSHASPAPEPAFLLGRASVLPRAPRLWTPPPSSEGLQCCHTSHGSGPRLPAQEGSSTGMCPMSRGAPTRYQAIARRAGRRRYHDLWLMCSAARLTSHGRGWQKLQPNRMELCSRPHAAWQDRQDGARQVPPAPSLGYIGIGSPLPWEHLLGPRS